MQSALMTTASELRSGKTHRDENFPVASWVIHPRHRALILAFYNFVRTADDIADHEELDEREKLTHLDLLEAELVGRGDSQSEAVNLRRALAERSMSPRHALDVLTAFRMDVTKLRYETWDELIHYCRYSAMPVGRFMLDVHGESTSTWTASDALCAGLQINNHLQDCGKDYRNLNRVYLPRDALAAAGASVEQLGEDRASPPLLQCLHSLAVRNEALLDESKPLGTEVRDFRLGLEISVIQAFADKIVRLLKVRDPLSQRVHLGPAELLALSLSGVASELTRRAVGRGPCPNRRPAHDARGGGSQRELRVNRVRQFVLRSDAHSAARAARGDVSDLQLLPAGRRHRRFRRAAARSGWLRCSNGATTSTRSIRAIRRRDCGITPHRFDASI